MFADRGGGGEGVARGPTTTPCDNYAPNDTLHDQTIWLSQLLNVLKSQYFGDTIPLISPDGIGSALLNAIISGIVLNQDHKLECMSGEICLNMNMHQILANMEYKKWLFEWL